MSEFRKMCAVKVWRKEQEDGPVGEDACRQAWVLSPENLRGF